MITVVNKRQYEGQGIYIGRPSILGNPFKVSEYGRGNCIEPYRQWLRQEWVKGGKVRQELIRLAELSKREDLVLVCWCKPLACHGDVIKDAVEKIAKIP